MRTSAFALRPVLPATQPAATQPLRPRRAHSPDTRSAYSLDFSKIPIQPSPQTATLAGQPLSPQLRAQAEYSLGADFSEVRIHSDRQAEGVGALAFTRGSDIHVAPEATSGQGLQDSATARRLLGHELTHVLQQRAGRVPSGGVVEDTALEAEADAGGERVSRGEAAFWTAGLATPSKRHGLAAIQCKKKRHAAKSAPETVPEPAAAVTETGPLTLLPSFSQRSMSCGVAPLISALIIWDREKNDPKAPNALLVRACELLVQAINANVYERKGNPSIIKNLDNQRIRKEDAIAKVNEVIDTIEQIGATAKKPGAVVTIEQYQMLTDGLTELYSLNAWEGLGMDATNALRRVLGFGAPPIDKATDFDRMLRKPALADLKPGDLAQLAWPVRKQDGSVGEHMFMIGRLQDKDGTWFLLDPGRKPATRIVAKTKPDLLAELDNGSSWFVRDSNPSPDHAEQHGVVYLGSRAGYDAHREVAPGRFLAAVQAHFYNFSSEILAGNYLSEHNKAEQAHEAAQNISRAGSLVLQMQNGSYLVYETNQLDNDSNLAVKGIDESATRKNNGALTDASFRKQFPAAWLILCYTTGQKTALLKVY